MAKTLRSVAFATVLTVLFPFVGGTQTLPAATDSLAPDFRIQVFGDTVTAWEMFGTAFRSALAEPGAAAASPDDRPPA